MRERHPFSAGASVWVAKVPRSTEHRLDAKQGRETGILARLLDRRGTEECSHGGDREQRVVDPLAVNRTRAMGQHLLDGDPVVQDLLVSFLHGLAVAQGDDVELSLAVSVLLLPQSRQPALHRRRGSRRFRCSRARIRCCFPLFPCSSSGPSSSPLTASSSVVMPRSADLPGPGFQGERSRTSRLYVSGSHHCTLTFHSMRALRGAWQRPPPPTRGPAATLRGGAQIFKAAWGSQLQAAVCARPPGPGCGGADR